MLHRPGGRKRYAMWRRRRVVRGPEAPALCNVSEPQAYVSLPLGSGMGRPNSRAVSIHC